MTEAATLEPAAEVELNSRQRAWLLFHAGEHPVHRHAWLDAARRQAKGPPETWVYLRAWKRPGFFLETCTIHRDDRAGLEGLFDPTGWRVTDAGRKALEQANGR